MPDGHGTRRARLSLMRRPAAAAILLFGGAALVGSTRPGGNPAPQRLRYDRDIRPILADRCFMCHGPDANKRRAKLRLDLVEDATATHEDGTPVVPGDLDASEVWRRINSTDPTVHMPPPQSTKPPLNDEQKAMIGAGIKAGAPDEPHWAFVPPTRSPVPESKHAASNPIDRFLLVRLEKEGIEPSPEADKPTLLRRLFLD